MRHPAVAWTAAITHSSILIFAAACATTQPAPAPAVPVAADSAFSSMLDAVDAAQLELQNGRPAAFKALWSHTDDITLSGGFGGNVERGWEMIGSRLDWVGAQFSNGTHQHERIATGVSGDLGYVVQAEHVRFTVPGKTTESTRDYRVTMIFRREAGQWKIVHRQADSQVVKQAPQ